MENKEKPFNSFQYEWINGNLVKKDEYEDDCKEREKKMYELEKLTDKNSQTINTMLSVVSKLVIPISLTIVGAIISMFFSLLQK